MRDTFAETPLSARLQEADRQEEAGGPIIPFHPVLDAQKTTDDEAAERAATQRTADEEAAKRAAAQQEYARQQREANASNAQLQIMKASTNGARNELELVRAGLMAKFELITSIINLKTDELDDTRKAILGIDAALQALA